MTNNHNNDKFCIKIMYYKLDLVRQNNIYGISFNTFKILSISVNKRFEYSPVMFTRPTFEDFTSMSVFFILH